MKGCNNVRETRKRRMQLSLFSTEEDKEAQVRFCDNQYCTLKPSVLQRERGREGEGGNLNLEVLGTLIFVVRVFWQRGDDFVF